MNSHREPANRAGEGRRLRGSATRAGRTGRRPRGIDFRQLTGAALWLCLACLPARHAAAQPAAAGPESTAVPAPKAEPRLTAEEVQSRLKKAQESTDLEEAIKTRLSEVYNQALQQLKAAEDAAANAARFDQYRSEASDRARTLEERLAQPPEDPPVLLPPDATVVQLEQILAEAQQDLETARKELNRAETEPKRRSDRRIEISKRIPEIRTQLADVEKTLATEPPAADAVAQAAYMLRKATKQALQAELAALESELATYDATGELLTLELRNAARRLFLAERRFQQLNRLVVERRGSEADQQLESAKQMVAELTAEEAPQVLIDLALANVDLASRRVGRMGLAEFLRRATAGHQETLKQLQELNAERQSIEEKLRVSGMESAIGQLLIEQRNDLPDVRRRQQYIRLRERGIARLRLEKHQIEDEFADATAVEQRLEEILAEMGGEQADRWRETTRALLESQRQLRDAVLRDADALFRKLLEWNEKDQELVAGTNDFRDLLDEHILWIRSTVPLWDVRRDDIARSANWMLQADHWTNLWQTVLDAMLERPLYWGLLVTAIAVLLLFRRPMRRRLTDVGELTSKSYTQPFQLTVEALMLTCLISTTAPLLLWFIGWNAATSTLSNEFARSAGIAALTSSGLLFSLVFVRHLCRPGGLADAHFRWRPERLRAMRRNTRWMFVVSIPLLLVFLTLHNQSNEALRNSLGRWALIVELLLTSLWLFRGLRRITVRSSGEQQHAAASETVSPFARFLFYAAVAAPVILAMVSALGFQYTAVEMAARFVATLWLGLALYVGHAMALRWLYLARARLALEQIKAQQEAAAEAGDGKGTDESPLSLQEAERKFDLAKINLHTRRMLQIVITTLAVIGLAAIWGGVIPVLEFLNIELWQDPDLRWITLTDVLLAVVVVVVVYVGGRNLPGLLEVAVLQRLPLDAGARNAASSLVRYVINGTGIVVAFYLLGVQWSQLQWLVAAIGLGLGFGLQEIFANFVSGIILLFERPIRVGDIVRIGDVMGTVTRIQIRATTIRDWDRMEFIVPNKELITGKLQNWTLSDTVNRLVINVGIAYGSDTEQARELLRRILRDHPLVLRDPEPVVAFEGFGDSKLNFVVRAYLSDFEHRLEVIHQLHTAIHREFAAAGVQIAFPQRDLHLRTIDGVLPIAQAKLSSDSNGRETPQPQQNEPAEHTG